MLHRFWLAFTAFTVTPFGLATNEEGGVVDSTSLAAPTPSFQYKSGMKHDETYMSHVSSKKQDSMVWQFTRLGEFHYACLISAHFEAGMVGKINVVKG